VAAAVVALVLLVVQMVVLKGILAAQVVQELQAA
jgi:hypothetical protein